MVPIPDRSRTRLLVLLIKRLALGLLTAVAAFSLTFFILRLIGTDPIDSLLAQGLANADQADALRQRLGLDQPLFNQYLTFITGILRWDFGVSLYTQRSVGQTIWEQFRWTAELALSGLLVGILVGLILGIGSAWWKERAIGQIAALLASLLTTIPVAFAGILMLTATASLRLAGTGLLLPSLVLGLTISGPIGRLIYAHLAESLASPYILAARARGIRRGWRLLWHALRPLLPPLLSLIALEAAFLFAGTVITETVFSRPGLGRLMVRAILDGDYPVTQGLVTVAALIYTASQVIADWLALIFDPRMRDAA